MGVKGRLAWIVALAMVVALVAGPAMAEDASQVESLIRQGLDLREGGKDGRALPLFQKAYALARTPRTAGQLGLCELALGYWTDAERYLVEGLASPHHPWIAKNQSALEKSLELARANIGELVVAGDPQGAQVLIDGHESGRLPLPQPIRLDKGPHDVVLQAPDYAPAKRALEISGGQKQTVTLTLEKIGAPSAPPSTPPAAASAPSMVASAAPPPAESGVGTRRTLAWVAGGAAALALVVGVLETINLVDKRNKFDDHVGPFDSNPALTGKNCGSDDPSYGGAGCQSLHDELSTARTLTIVGYAAAGVLAAGSAVLFATAHSTEAAPSQALSCTPDLQGKGLSCRISF